MYQIYTQFFTTETAEVVVSKARTLRGAKRAAARISTCPRYQQITDTRPGGVCISRRYDDKQGLTNWVDEIPF